jgi:hypothetical protein
MESVVTITAPPSRSASAIASADLPLPVGPAISSTRAFFSLSRAFCMTHLCTLIADRTTRIITPAVRDKAAAVITETLGGDVTVRSCPIIPPTISPLWQMAAKRLIT